MVTRLVRLGVTLVALLWALPVAAQTTQANDDEPGRPYSRWSLGLLSGAHEVERKGYAAGMELSVRIRKGLHIVVEGGTLSDVVTGRRIDEVQTFVRYVENAYEVPASGEIDGPAWFAMGGFKLIPDGARPGESAGVRPYAILTAGIARVEYKPEFIVDGTSVSGAGLFQYGVSLGRDLLGTTNRFAYSGGVGVIFGDRWYLDLGARVTRIHSTDHPTTVKRLVIGMGRRF